LFSGTNLCRHRDELKLAGVFVRIFNEQPTYTIKNPKEFTTALLNFLGRQAQYLFTQGVMVTEGVKSASSEESGGGGGGGGGSGGSAGDIFEPSNFPANVGVDLDGLGPGAWLRHLQMWASSCAPAVVSRSLFCLVRALNKALDKAGLGQSRVWCRHLFGADTCSVPTRVRCRHVFGADTCSVPTLLD
jgi:hypothetical protein